MLVRFNGVLLGGRSSYVDWGGPPGFPAAWALFDPPYGTRRNGSWGPGFLAIRHFQPTRRIEISGVWRPPLNDERPVNHSSFAYGYQRFETGAKSYPVPVLGLC